MRRMSDGWLREATNRAAELFTCAAQLGLWLVRLPRSPEVTSGGALLVRLPSTDSVRALRVGETHGHWTHTAAGAYSAVKFAGRNNCCDTVITSTLFLTLPQRPDRCYRLVSCQFFCLFDCLLLLFFFQLFSKQLPFLLRVMGTFCLA